LKEFVIIPALVVLLVIPLWAALGVLEMVEEEGEGGHAHSVADGPEQIRAFREAVDDFVSANTRADGCVVPRAPLAEEHHNEHDEDTEHHAGETEQHGHKEGVDDQHVESGETRVVYLQAFQFGYRPNRICLKSGVEYEFRMMSMDVIHGASIQLGPGSRMIRLNPGVVTNVKVTFTEPGEYLLYCTAYCGIGHPLMAGKIIVETLDEHEDTDVHEHPEEAEPPGYKSAPEEYDESELEPHEHSGGE
jgi:heme/copper-type cytochrome/quinol oxidase subunit 2